MLVLLDSFVSLTLLGVTFGLLPMVYAHRFLAFGVRTLAPKCGHCLLVAFQAVLNMLNRSIVSVEEFAVLAELRFKLHHLSECSLVLRPPKLKVIDPHRMLALPLPVFGMHTGEVVCFSSHYFAPSGRDIATCHCSVLQYPYQWTIGCAGQGQYAAYTPRSQISARYRTYWRGQTHPTLISIPQLRCATPTYHRAAKIALR
jgi:hypothetical protein